MKRVDKALIVFAVFAALLVAGAWYLACTTP